MTLCTPVDVNRRFGETFRLRLQGRRVNQASLILACSAYSSTLKMGLYIPSKRR
jgi:hypothetical protein